MIRSASRMGIPAIRPHQAGGGRRELRPAGGLLSHVAHPDHLTGGVSASARARAQGRMIALQLPGSLAATVVT